MPSGMTEDGSADKNGQVARAIGLSFGSFVSTYAIRGEKRARMSQKPAQRLTADYLPKAQRLPTLATRDVPCMKNSSSKSY